MTKSWALELGPSATVDAVGHGPIKTEVFRTHLTRRGTGPY